MIFSNVRFLWFLVPASAGAQLAGAVIFAFLSIRFLINTIKRTYLSVNNFFGRSRLLLDYHNTTDYNVFIGQIWKGGGIMAENWIFPNRLGTVTEGLIYAKERVKIAYRPYAAKPYRLVAIKGYRRLSGWEEQGVEKKDKNTYDHRLSESLIRTRQRIKELASCNKWDWWVTLTMSPDKFDDRYELESNRKKIIKWLQNKNAKRSDDQKIKYMFVPDRHKDGAIHYHGFITGLIEEELIKFTLDDHLPYSIRERIEMGFDNYDWPDYSKKFGYTYFERIQSREAASAYAAKYINKGMLDWPKNVRLIVASSGLLGQQVLLDIHDGDLCDRIANVSDFEKMGCYIVDMDEDTVKKLIGDIDL